MVTDYTIDSIYFTNIYFYNITCLITEYCYCNENKNLVDMFTGEKSG